MGGNKSFRTAASTREPVAESGTQKGQTINLKKNKEKLSSLAFICDHRYVPITLLFLLYHSNLTDSYFHLNIWSKTALVNLFVSVPWLFLFQTRQ